MSQGQIYKRMLSPAKLNLVLRIGGLRFDGYHTLESLMLPVTWGDEISLRFRKSRINKISLSTRGLNIPPSKNLAFRAAEEFSRAFGKKFELKIELKKRIPTGAGLGGGSGNAAVVLSTLAKIHKIPLNVKLLKVARNLGADVAVFLYQQACWCTGVGEVCRPVNLPQLWFVILLSRKTPTPTPLAYRALDKARGRFASKWPLPGMPDYLKGRDWSIPRLENDFEEVVLKLKPRLRAVRSALTASGALAVSMSGSGSSFFGVYANSKSSHRAARQLRAKGFEAISCSSLSSWTK